MPEASACYHCGSPVPAGTSWHITLDETAHPLCCPGCEAVAHAIVNGGLESYYHQRTKLPERPVNDAPSIDLWAHFDRPDQQSAFVSHDEGTGSASATLAVEGITCNACAWLIEHRLNALEGIVSSAVSLPHHRLNVRWQPDQLKLSRLLAELAAIGYSGVPFTPDPAQAHLHQQTRLMIRRLTMAAASLVCLGLLAFYRPMSGAEPGVSQADTLSGWLGLMLASAVVFVAKPFFLQAFGELRRGRFGPLLPIAIALLGAYLASIYGTLWGAGETYVGFIAMLVTFLLLSRTITFHYALKEVRRARLPALATRLEGEDERVLPISELSAGDLVRVNAGQPLPVDGTIVQGESSLDESRLTGEPLPVTRKVGDAVLCGCQNLENPLVIKVTQAGHHTRIARIDEQMSAAWGEQALTELDARKVHGWVVCMLLATAAVALFEPTQTLDNVFSMLIAGSPFALALATPTSLLAGYWQLRRRGVVVAGPDALLSLAQAVNADLAACSEVMVLSPRASRREEALCIARLAIRCARQNQCMAFGISLALLLLAALGYLPPWGAVVGACASTLVVFGNTQRLLGLYLHPTRGKP